MNLGIIIKGQLRTFFSTNFSNVLELCLEKYQNILIILVISDLSEDISNLLEIFFSNYPIIYYIIDYNDYIDQYLMAMNKKIQSDIFNTHKKNFLSLHPQGIDEFPFIPQLNTGREFHQLSIGMKKLLEFHNSFFPINVVLVTRFDIQYPQLFYPHVPESKNMLDILSFNQYNKKLLLETMEEFNLKNIDDLIQFNKYSKIILPNCHIEKKKHNISFGLDYFYNYMTLERIKSGNNNIIYSFEVFSFGTLYSICILENIFDEYLLLEPVEPELFYRFFAYEAQLINFFLLHNRCILAYKNDSYSLVR